jgi:type IV pilus biogenesis protein PilP
VARAAPAAAPAVAPPAPQQQASPGRGPVALVGVFGSADRRHALLQMPNGSIQRVRAGQTVAGVQVAAVAGDSVRVLVNGRESTLRLPD